MTPLKQSRRDRGLRSQPSSPSIQEFLELAGLSTLTADFETPSRCDAISVVHVRRATEEAAEQVEALLPRRPRHGDLLRRVLFDHEPPRFRSACAAVGRPSPRELSASICLRRFEGLCCSFGLFDLLRRRLRCCLYYRLW